jgi:hypothetical protein
LNLVEQSYVQEVEERNFTHHSEKTNFFTSGEISKDPSQVKESCITEHEKELLQASVDSTLQQMQYIAVLLENFDKIKEDL